VFLLLKIKQPLNKWVCFHFVNQVPFPPISLISNLTRDTSHFATQLHFSHGYKFAIPLLKFLVFVMKSAKGLDAISAAGFCGG
jgi:hypothetical protein